MEAKDLSCWKCGASLEGVPLPISRMGECLSCRAELHVCRLCEFYDTSVAEDCREPMAQEVKDKTRANFCEYFYPRPGAHAGVSAVGSKPSDELEALFGGGLVDSVFLSFSFYPLEMVFPGIFLYQRVLQQIH